MDLEWNEGNRAFEDRTALSPAGIARREAMLRDLKAAVVRRRRQRTALRAAIAGAACIALAVVLVDRFVDVPPRPGPPEIATPRQATPLILANVRLETVRDAPDLVAKMIVEDRPISPSTFTDDEGLLSSLAAAEPPAGLIRFQGGVVLAYYGEGPRPPDAAPDGDGL